MKKIFFLMFIFLFYNLLFANEIKDWVGKSWIEGSKLYFSGISEPSENLKIAKELAYNDAVLNAAKYLGIKVSNKTKSEIKNNDISLRTQTSTFLDDTFISYAEIKDFIFDKKNDKYTAYLLIEIDKHVLDKEQQRKDKLEQNEQEKIKKQELRINENKESGRYKLIIPKKINSIKNDIENIFKNSGYIIENKIVKNENIKKINVKVVDEQIDNVIDDMFSYSIKVSVTFNDKFFILKSEKVSEDNVNIAKKLAYKDILKQLQEYLTK